VGFLSGFFAGTEIDRLIEEGRAATDPASHRVVGRAPDESRRPPIAAQACAAMGAGCSPRILRRLLPVVSFFKGWRARLDLAHRFSIEDPFVTIWALEVFQVRYDVRFPVKLARVVLPDFSYSAAAARWTSCDFNHFIPLC
jgi:hypothetical protein